MGSSWTENKPSARTRTLLASRLLNVTAIQHRYPGHASTTSNRLLMPGCETYRLALQTGSSLSPFEAASRTPFAICALDRTASAGRVAFPAQLHTHAASEACTRDAEGYKAQTHSSKTLLSFCALPILLLHHRAFFPQPNYRLCSPPMTIQDRHVTASGEEGFGRNDALSQSNKPNYRICSASSERMPCVRTLEDSPL